MSPPAHRTCIRAALAAAGPICLGYFPIGLSLGVLAQKTGLAPGQVLLMSVLVFAGGSQFIAVAMLGSGAAAPAIITTTFLVNLRHLLMSSALAVHLPHLRRRFLALFAYGITDESFAVNLTRFRDGTWEPRQALLVNQAANLAWIIATVAGVHLGQFIPAGAFGIDYALTAMFLCLLVFQLRSRLFVVTALLAAVFAVSIALLLPGNAYVIIASMLAATAGFFLKQTLRDRKGWQ